MSYVSSYNPGGFYPGTTVPLSAIPLGTPTGGDPTGMGVAPSNNINGGNISGTTPNAFTTGPQSPSFNTFGASPSSNPYFSSNALNGGSNSTGGGFYGGGNQYAGNFSGYGFGGIQGAPTRSAPLFNGQPMSNAQQYYAAQRAPMLQWLMSHPDAMEGLLTLGQSEIGNQGPDAANAWMETELNRAYLANQLDPSNGYNFFNNTATPTGVHNQFAYGPSFAGPSYGNQPLPNTYPGPGVGNNNQEMAPIPNPIPNDQYSAMMDALNYAVQSGQNPQGIYTTGNASGSVNQDPSSYWATTSPINGERFVEETWWPQSTYQQQQTLANQYVPGGLGPGAPTFGNFGSFGGPPMNIQQQPIPFMPNNNGGYYGGYGGATGGYGGGGPTNAFVNAPSDPNGTTLPEILIDSSAPTG